MGCGPLCRRRLWLTDEPCFFAFGRGDVTTTGHAGYLGALGMSVMLHTPRITSLGLLEPPRESRPRIQGLGDRSRGVRGFTCLTNGGAVAQVRSRTRPPRRISAVLASPCCAGTSEPVFL